MNDIWASKWLVDREKAWFIPGIICNCLMEYDFYTQKCLCLTMINNNHKEWWGNFYDVIKFENTYYCLPHKENKIVVYDKETNELSKILIGYSDEINLEMRFHFTYEKEKEAIYSYTLQSLVILNLRNKTIEEIRPIFDKQMLRIDGVIKIKNCLYGISEENGYIYECNIENGRNQHYQISNSEPLELTLMCSDGDKLLLSGKSSVIYEWKIGQKEANIIRIKTEDNWDESVKLPIFYDSVFVNNKFYFFPYRGNEIIVLNGSEIKKIRIAKIDVNKLVEKNGINCVSMVTYCREERFIGYYVVKDGKQYELDTLDDSIRKLDIEYVFDKEMFLNHNYLNIEYDSSGFGSLESYLYYLT